MGFMARNDRGQKPGKKFGPKTAFLDSLRLLRWIAVIMMRKDQSTSTFIMSFTPEAGC
jgi:hypothetical protein